MVPLYLRQTENVDRVNEILRTKVSRGHSELPGFVAVLMGEHMHQRWTGPERRYLLHPELVL